jgi:TPR repeat protein
MGNQDISLYFYQQAAEKNVPVALNNIAAYLH